MTDETPILPVRFVGWASCSVWHFCYRDEAGEPGHLTCCGVPIPTNDRTLSNERHGWDPLCMNCIEALDKKYGLKLQESHNG